MIYMTYQSLLSLVELIHWGFNSNTTTGHRSLQVMRSEPYITGTAKDLHIH